MARTLLCIGLVVAHSMGMSFTVTHAVTLGSRVARRDPNANFQMNINSVTWGPGCNDVNPAEQSETKQDAIIRAWAGALELAQDAQARFRLTKQNLAPVSPRQSPSPLQKLQVRQLDPAYVQFFKLDWTDGVMINIMGLWDRMNHGINAEPGTAGRPPKPGGEINISCETHWDPFGQGNNECDGAYAVTRNNRDFSTGNRQSSALNFCDRFFYQDRFDVFKTLTAPGSREGDAGNPIDYYRARDLTYQDGTDGMYLHSNRCIPRIC